MLTCYHGDLIQIADNTPNKLYLPPHLTNQPPACCKKYFLSFINLFFKEGKYLEF